MPTLLSIIIPTKNRYNTLVPCLDTLLSLEYNDFEIVIQDNSDDNSEILDYLNLVKSEKIHYFYEQKHLPISENIDLAIKNSKGEFVICIGDDDTVSKKLFEIVEYMKKEKLLSCSFNFIRYYWPDLRESINNYKPILIPSDMDGDIRFVNPIDELIKIMKTNVFRIHNMPIIYHGVLARSVLDSIFQISGTYCPGPSPDISNATAASLIVKKHMIVNMALTVAGHSYVSAGGMGARKKHVRELDDVPWISKDDKVNWEKKLPKIWTAETVWSESLLKSLKNMNEPNILKNFNYYRFYANFILHHPSYFLKAFKASPTASILGCIRYAPVIIGKKIIRDLNRKNSKSIALIPYELADNSLKGAFDFTNEFNNDIKL